MKPVILFLGLFLFVIGFSGCSEKNNFKYGDKDMFAGIWVSVDTVEEINRIVRSEYSFMEDDTFEFLQTEINLNSGEILGYSLRWAGKYNIGVEKVIFYDFNVYWDEDPVIEIDSMDLRLENFTDNNINYIFEEDGEKLTLYYICDCTACNCVPPMYLKRE